MKNRMTKNSGVLVVAGIALAVIVVAMRNKRETVAESKDLAVFGLSKNDIWYDDLGVPHLPIWVT